ncbi:Odorant-binding protein 69a [Carabus blaptoides fortunei]
MQGVHLLITVLALTVCASNVRSVELQLSEEMKELMAMLHETCVDETGVNEDLISATMKGKFPEDGPLKCYMKCILVQGAGMDEDGIIDVEAIIAMLPDELQADVPSGMRKCGTQTGVDDCDTAFKTNKCWYEHMPAKYFLI